MKKQLIRLLGMAMFLLSVGTITAQQGNDKKGKFMAIDTNGDKLISMSELRTFRIAKLDERGKEFSEEKFAERFRKADQDGNGLLDLDEMKRVRRIIKERRGR